MKISPLGWLLTAVSVASLALLGPQIRVLAAPQDFSSSLIDLIALIQVALSTWVLASLALLLAARRCQWARRLAGVLTPQLIRRALVTGMAGALVFAPASADSRPAVPTGDHGTADHGGVTPLNGLLLPDRPSGQSRPSTLPSGTVGANVAVEVRTGDSLWSIAAESLPAPATDAQIVAASGRWYAANRDAIGHDPDLIFPHLVLHAPQPEESP